MNRFGSGHKTRCWFALFCVFTSLPSLIHAQGTASASYQLSLEAPSKVNSYSDTIQFDAAAVLRTSSEAQTGALGWTVGISADGCLFTTATTAGTSGDLEANGGLRRDGDSFEFTELVLDGAGIVSGVALSFSEEVVLEPANSPHTLLKIGVGATTPGTGGDCNHCTLSYVDGLVGSGEPVENEVTVLGESVPAVLHSTTIDVCRSEFQFSFTTPTQISTNAMVEFDAMAVLTTNSETVAGAQGWTVAISSTDCVFTDATTSGTAADLETNGGLRKHADSFEFTELVLNGGGVVSGVALSFREELVLAPVDSPHAILKLRVHATAPNNDTSCRECTLSFVDGLAGSGEPTDNEVTAQNKAVSASLESETIDICLSPFELSFDTPAALEAPVPGATVSGEVKALLSSSLDSAAAAQGWTIGIRASGCVIASTTTEGTVAALEADGGLRKEEDSFEFTEIILGGAGVLSEAVLSFSEDTTLQPANSPHTILGLQVEANGPNPALGCSECTIAYVDGLVGSGEAVDNEITLLNEAVPSSLHSATIDICTTPFELSFDAPTQIDESAFTASALLDTTFLGSVGAQGWSIGVSADGCNITGATTSGTAADLEENGGFRKSVDGFELTDLTTGPGNEGAVSQVTLSVSDAVTLPSLNRPHTVLSLTVGATLPEFSGDCAPCILSYKDGLAGTSSPVDNEVLFLGELTRPPTLSATVDVCNTSTVSGQIPGDLNEDGRIDLSDPVRLAGFLFLGTPSVLPCGDGSNTDPGNALLADWNGDGRNDIADIVGELGWLFRGRSAHALDIRGDGSTCVPIPGCGVVCGP